MTKTVQKIWSFVIAAGLPIVLAQPVFADAAGVTQVENFMKSVIQVMAGLAGLVATGFFVMGGYQYITSSGNPEHLLRAKRTLVYSAAGLSIVIAAFVITSVVSDLATNAFGS
jgi:TRAP-type C4-dicarboxylate transport system permease small subunit